MNRAGLALLPLALVVLFLLAISRSPSPPTMQSPTATSTWTLTRTPPAPPTPNPVVDATDAISRSLELFPSRGNASSPIAVLVERATYEHWLLYTGMTSSAAATAASLAALDPTPTSNVPVWFVAILGTGLTVDDVVIDPTGGQGGEDRRAVDGAYYVWSAGGGRLMEVGALVTGAPHNYSSIALLPTAVSTYVAATQQPAPALVTALPTYTWSPALLATVAVLLTAQSQPTTTATPTP